MTTLEAKIRATVQYSAYFDFPLTVQEIWYWLASNKPVSRPKVEQALATTNLGRLKRFVVTRLTPSRRYRAKVSREKLISAQRVARIIGLLPGVRLIALTGSAAVGNSLAGDDLDLMILTRANRLWLLRPIIVLLVELLFHRRRPQQGKNLRNSVCLNLWLDEKALAIPVSKRNLYSAHEALQLVPLVNKKETYERFLATNRWLGNYLANAWQEKENLYHLGKQSNIDKPDLLAGINQLAFRLQYRYMQAKITSETVSLHAAYFHPRDWHKQLSPHLKEVELK